VTPGDFNGDGKVDLAVANQGEFDPNTGSYSNGSVAILTGRGDGTFDAAVNYGPNDSPRRIGVGDFNGDNRPDLAVVSQGGVSVLIGRGNGTFQVGAKYAAGYNSGFVALTDFNRDGQLDLAVQNYSGGIAVLAGNGDGTFRAAVNYFGGTSSAAVGDFDGDGRPDLVALNNLLGNGSVSVMLNTCVPDVPVIGVARVAPMLTLSWPFPSTGYILESTTSLSPLNWQLAVEVPMTNNGRVEVSVPLSQQERYLGCASRSVT